jgi:hypothetical protein
MVCEVQVDAAPTNSVDSTRPSRPQDSRTRLVDTRPRRRTTPDRRDDIRTKHTPDPGAIENLVDVQHHPLIDMLNFQSLQTQTSFL